METFSLLEEYRVLRERAGVRERTEMGRLAASGADRLSYLQAMLTNDIAALRSGSGCYSAYLTPQGRMISDMTVLNLGDLVLLDLPVAVKSDVQARLEQFVFSEDVQLTDLTGQLAGLSVTGPTAADVVARALDRNQVLRGTLSELPEHASVRTAFGRASVVVAAAPLGVPSFDIYVDRDHEGLLRGAILDAGAVSVAGAAYETLRIESGRARFGTDMDADTIPLEAGIEQRAISFTKGCYPGQEVIARVLHRGHGRVARRLVGIRIEGETVPSHGDPFVVGERNAGAVTSATFSPVLNTPVALGYLHRDFASPGTSVVIVHGGVRLIGAVAELPFVGA